MATRVFGRHEVKRRRDRLRNTFDQVSGVQLDSELVSHYSRYLTVLISGYAEQGIKELVRQYVRNHSDDRTQRYVGKQLDKLRNVDKEKLRQLLHSLEVAWWDQLQVDVPDELEALDSVATIRNNVSHGGDSGITIGTAEQYFAQVDAVLHTLCDILDPP